MKLPGIFQYITTVTDWVQRAHEHHQNRKLVQTGNYHSLSETDWSVKVLRPETWDLQQYCSLSDVNKAKLFKHNTCVTTWQKKQNISATEKAKNCNSSYAYENLNTAAVTSVAASQLALTPVICFSNHASSGKTTSGTKSVWRGTSTAVTVRLYKIQPWLWYLIPIWHPF